MELLFMSMYMSMVIMNLVHLYLQRFIFFTNIKNISALNFVELRKEYKKYNIYVALEQINIIKKVAHHLNKEGCFMLMT